MFEDVIDYLKPYFQPDTRRGQRGLIALGAYLVLSIASVVIAVTGGARPANALGASVHWRSGEGATYETLVVTNQSGDPWSDIIVVLDERYYHRLETMDINHTVALTIGDFQDGYDVPRPEGTAPYERYTEWPEDTGPPTGYRPSEVRIRAAEGELNVTLGE